ncbi:ATP-binding protein [Oscillospiraceae bacterium OttesenSCG-928-F05]|nr:ATP-binding protein [Oscillospiraceae bacterium OttesenSCG-928-F05]
MEERIENITPIENRQSPRPLAQRCTVMLKLKEISKTEFAHRIGYSATSVKLYLSGRYSANPTHIEDKILSVFGDQLPDEQAAMEQTQLPDESEGALFESRDAVNIFGLCHSCQEFSGLGVVVGRSGYGKTYTLRHYASTPRVVYIECDEMMAPRDLLTALERSVGLQRNYGTNWTRANVLREYFSNYHGHLIIIDEADKLISRHTQKKIEVLRGIFDQSKVGLVLAGEQALQVQLDTYLPRLANRVDFFYKLSGLQVEEISEFLSGYAIDDTAMKELTRRARDKRIGCFRLLQRTLQNIMRILDEEGSDHITINTVNKASALMML